jgi:hypothetical protein
MYVCIYLSIGITLTSIYEYHEPTLLLIFNGIQCGDADVVKESCGLLREILVLNEYPRSDKRADVVKMIIGHVTSSITVLAPFFGVGGDEDTAYEICNFMVEICNSEVDIVTSPIGIYLSIYLSI